MSVSRQDKIASKQEQLAKIEEKKKQLLSQIKLLQKPTKKERDARTHRLCQIGGLVDKYAGHEVTDLVAFETWLSKAMQKQKTDTGGKSNA